MTDVVEDIKLLWNEDVIRDLHRDYTKRSRIFLQDSAGYFWDNIDRVTADGYVPTDKISYQFIIEQQV